jgi:hypothetical protein
MLHLANHCPEDPNGHFAEQFDSQGYDDGPVDEAIFATLTTDRWYEVGEEQRAIEQERQRRELEAAEIARKQFYGQS